MKKLLCLFFIIHSLPVFSQDEKIKEPSKESQAYHISREELTEPPYGLRKIEAKIELIKSDSDDNMKLDAKFYQSLSFREKFTYHMIHGETYSQNCDGYPTLMEENKKIFAHFPDLFGEYSWSAKQINFFKNNRDSVIALMKLEISKTNRIGLNFKYALVEINAKELIPFLISTYQVTKKDRDILTLLLLLMKGNKYPPFLSSTSFKKLYADEDRSWGAWIVFNTANEELIIKRATDFYNETAK